MNAFETEFQEFLRMTLPGEVPAKDSLQYVQLRCAFYGGAVIAMQLSRAEVMAAQRSFLVEIAGDVYGDDIEWILPAIGRVH